MDGDHQLVGFSRQNGNALRQLRHMHIPGVDSILRQIFPGNKENNFFPRFASSAANQTGKKLAVSETFGVYGNGVTFNQMRYICNYQFIRGINIINIMSITSGRDSCLSLQCRPHFVPQLPMVDHMRKFNDYLSRISYLCRLGDVCSKTALYMPMRAVWCGMEECEEMFWEMGKKLEEKQVYFDIIDDDYIMNHFSDLIYNEIYIPTDKYMPEKVCEILENYKGKICYDVSEAEGFVQSDNPHIRVMKRELQGETLYMLFNESEERQKAEIKFSDSDKGYLLDCTNGSIKKLSKTSFLFESGEIIAVLFSNESYDCVNVDKLNKMCEIDKFEVLPHSRIICKDGKIYQTDKDMVIDKNFSGKVYYSAEFEYDGDDDLIFEFDYIHESATVFVNGKEIDDVIMTPYRLIVKRADLADLNKVDILVANTSANALISGDYQNIPKEKIGPYHDRTIEFEKECRQIGVGKLKIYRNQEIS